MLAENKNNLARHTKVILFVHYVLFIRINYTVNFYPQSYLLADAKDLAVEVVLLGT